MITTQTSITIKTEEGLATIYSNELVVTKFIKGKAYTITIGVKTIDDVLKALSTAQALDSNSFIDFANIFKASTLDDPQVE